MHPNWRALATLHIPLKRFVTGGACTEEPSTSSYKNKYQVLDVDAIEIKEFYEEVISAPECTTKRKKIDPKVVSPPKDLPKIPFQKNKFFNAALTNDASTLQRFDYQDNDINSTDNFGWNALMMAACEGATESVETLIRLGIDIDCEDRSGNTAFLLAEKKKFYEIIDVLSKCKDEPFLSINEEKEDQDIGQSDYFCDVCRRKFQETALRDHVTSTVHQFNLKNNPKDGINRFSISSKNRGLKIMIKQGWDKQSGLGPSNSGRLFPVKTVIRKQRTGLGTQQDQARVTHFSAYDMRAIKYVPRPKTKNRNDIINEKKLEWKRERRLRRELS